MIHKLAEVASPMIYTAYGCVHPGGSGLETCVWPAHGGMRHFKKCAIVSCVSKVGSCRLGRV